MFSLFRSSQQPALFWHTDIHSHICPGIDDGSPSPAISVILVQEMSRLGFSRMVVTPHVTDETFPNTRERILHSFGILRQAVADAGLDMQLSCSAEYRIDDLLYKALQEHTILPMPGNYILIENSWFQEPFAIESLMFDLRSDHGLMPIMAHPERYGYYQHHRERLEALHSMGAAMQINLLSLAGHYGKGAQRTAEWLLQHDMVSFVGSDIHRPDHVEEIHKYICSRQYKKLERKAHLILNDTLPQWQ